MIYSLSGIFEKMSTTKRTSMTSLPGDKPQEDISHEEVD